MFKSISTLTLMFAFLWPQALLAQSKAPVACLVCQKIDIIESHLIKSPDTAVHETVQLMSTLQFSRIAQIRTQEVKRVLELAAKTLPKDDQGEIMDYLYTLSMSARRDFKTQLKLLSPADQKTVVSALKSMRGVYKSDGNG